MDTHLVLDDQLIQKALLVGQHRTKKAVVTKSKGSVSIDFPRFPINPRNAQ